MKCGLCLKEELFETYIFQSNSVLSKCCKDNLWLEECSCFPGWTVSLNPLFLSFLFYFIFRTRVYLCCPGWPCTHYVSQAGLELVILLPLLPQCWDCRHVSPHPVLTLDLKKNSKTIHIFKKE
jgi:hypothetical protein